MSNPSEKRRPFFLLPWAVAVAAVATFVLENWRSTAEIDDAYIVFRYARNLAHGNGFVLNVGERVEGVTTLLWTGLLAAGLRAGIDAELCAHVLGVLCGSVTLVYTFLYARRFVSPDRGWLAAVAPWLLWASPSFLLWSTAGLETPLFSALVLAALYSDSKGDLKTAAFASCVAILARPEGVLLVLVILGCRYFAQPEDRPAALRLGLACLLFMALLTAFRLAYFGLPLPNTFYAKVGGVTWWWGPCYALAFLVQVLPMLVSGSFAVAERPVRPPVRPGVRTGVAWCLAMGIYVVAVGGDMFNLSRFFVPILPVLCCLSARGIDAALDRNQRAGIIAIWSTGLAFVWMLFGTVAGLAVAVVSGLALSVLAAVNRGLGRAVPLGVAVMSGLLLVLIHWTPSPHWELYPKVILRSRQAEVEHSRMKFRYFNAVSQHMASELNRREPRDKLVAAIGIGVVGYYSSSARILDLLGLADQRVAATGADQVQGQVPEGAIRLPGHQRSNAAYILSRRPDYILLGAPRAADEESPIYIPADAALRRSPEFQREYEWDPSIPGYARRRP